MTKTFNKIPVDRPDTPLLNNIDDPSQLKALSSNELLDLSNEIREFILSFIKDGNELIDSVLQVPMGASDLTAAQELIRWNGSGGNHVLEAIACGLPILYIIFNSLGWMFPSAWESPNKMCKSCNLVG